MGSWPAGRCSRPRMTYGPIDSCIRASSSAHALPSEPRGPVATTASRSSRSRLIESSADGVAVVEALEGHVVHAEPLLAVEEVGQPVAEHRDLARDRAITGEGLELDTLHGRDGTREQASGPSGRWYRRVPAPTWRRVSPR